MNYLFTITYKPYTPVEDLHLVHPLTFTEVPMKM